MKTSFPLICYLFLILLGVIFFLLPSLSSEETRAQLDIKITEDYQFIFPSFNEINVTANYSFYNVSYKGETRNSTQLREIYKNGSEDQKQELLEFLSQQVEEFLNSVMSETFEHLSNKNINFSINLETLTDENYTGPVRAKGYGNATLSNRNFGLEEEVDVQDVLQGVFKMGAVVKMKVKLYAPEGNRRMLRVHAPEGLLFFNKEPEYSTLNFSSSHPDYLVWYLNNVTGEASPYTGEIYLKSKEPEPVEKEEIKLKVVVDWKEFDSTEIKVILEIYSVELAKYSELSNHILLLSYISADGVRMALENNLGNWSVQKVKERAAENVSDEIASVLTESLNLSSTLDLGFQWNESSLSGYDVEKMGSLPPLQAEMKSGPIAPNLYTFQETFETDDLEIIKGFLNAGARAEFSVDSMEFSEEYMAEVMLILPENMKFKDTAASESLYKGRYSYLWDPSLPLEGTIISTKAPQYNKSRIELDATIDFQKFNINLFNLESSSLSTKFTGKLDFYQIEVTKEMKDVLPAEVKIDYINADVIRLAYHKGLLDLDEIEEMIREKIEKYEKKISDSLGEKIYISVNIDDSTLNGYDIENMDNKPSIVVRGSTKVEIPLSGGAENLDGVKSSFIIKRVNFDFELPSLKDWKINLQVILPKGIEILKISDKEGTVVKGMADGRDSFSVLIEEKSNHVYMELGVTPAVIYETCQFYIFITLAISVLLMIRRRIKKKRKMLEEEENLSLNKKIISIKEEKDRLQP